MAAAGADPSRTGDGMSPARPRRGLTRRHVLELGAAWSGALLLPAGLRAAGAPAHTHGGSAVDVVSPVAPPFSAEFTTPPVLEPVLRDATTDYYELAVRPAMAEVIPGLPTPIWGYEGISPGPTIRARKGRRVVATFRNELPPDDDAGNLVVPFPNHGTNHDARPSSITVHLHGINARHEFDGFPEDTFVPGESFAYEWLNNDYQRPATLWYHDHSIDITGPHIYRGLQGLYILSDDAEDALPLPRGEFDVPLVIADAVIDRSGVLVYANGGEHNGVVGDVMTVNGASSRAWRSPTAATASGSSTAPTTASFCCGLSDGTPFDVIGADQGLLAGPEPASALLIAPAERYEIVIDFSRYALGTRSCWRTGCAARGPRRVASATPPRARSWPSTSCADEPDNSACRACCGPNPPPIPRAQAVRERHVRFNRRHGVWSINGLQWETDRADADPALDSTRSGTSSTSRRLDAPDPHPPRAVSHPRDQRNARSTPGETGWKDMVLLGPNVRASGHHGLPRTSAAASSCTATTPRTRTTT